MSVLAVQQSKQEWCCVSKYTTDIVMLSLVYKDKEPRGIIPLENLSIREVEDSKKPVNSLSQFT